MIKTLNRQSIETIVLLTIFLEIIAPIFTALTINANVVVALIRTFVSLIALIIIIINDKIILFKRPLVFYLLWTLYVYFKSLITIGSPIQLFVSIVTSSICLFSCVYAFQKNERTTMNIIIVALYVFCIISLFVGKSGIDSDEGRLGSEVLNSNAIGIRGALVVFFVIIKYLKKQISLIQLILLLAFPVLIVILTGSRTGFGMAVIYFSVFIFSKKSSNRSILGNIIGKLVLIVIAIAAYSWIAENTMVGERLTSTSTQIEGSVIETGTFWDLLGDRGFQYYIGLPLIKDYFWFGMGLGNFKLTVNSYEHVLHSEFLIQLLECGIIATILYFAVYLWIIKNTLSIKTNIVEDVTFKRYLLLSMIALLFACIVTRISFYGAYSCCIAYMIYYLKNYQLLQEK